MQSYDHEHTSQVVLYNSGKVGLDYSTLGGGKDSTPGSITVHPTTGHIPALEEQLISITLLPGVPSVFEKSVQIQVAHFEPDVITLSGEAVFPRIAFNTCRDLSAVTESVVEQAKTNVSVSEAGPELEAEVERLLIFDHAQQITSASGKTPKTFRYV